MDQIFASGAGLFAPVDHHHRYTYEISFNATLYPVKTDDAQIVFAVARTINKQTPKGLSDLLRIARHFHFG
jgi:hypothetical protein